MKERDAEEWEALARREPYFPVLTNEGIRDDAFLETGEADISLLFSAIASVRGGDVLPANALDFGCGAGRLTLPLARRARRVAGCDIAPTMIEHARKNADEAGLRNVTFLETGELAGLPDGQFDFVCSLLVFQHIAPPRGYALIRTLLRVLGPGGVAALQLTFEPPGGGAVRLARMLRTSRTIHRAARHDIRLPSYIEANAYDERVVAREIAAAGASVVGRFSTQGAGTVLVILRSS